MQAASLFSGCGGDCVGMTDAGLNVTEYVELSPLFCETHDANFGTCEKIGNDIQTISDETFSKYKGKWNVFFSIIEDFFPNNLRYSVSLRSLTIISSQVEIFFILSSRSYEPNKELKKPIQNFTLNLLTSH